VPKGSVVVVCPDQLGPSLLRYAGTTTYHYIGYPRYTSPRIVDWIDYKRAVHGITPAVFASRVVTTAGTSPIYVVWSKGYGFHQVCSDFVSQLAVTSGRTPQTLVDAKKYVYYQSMNLVVFPPKP
jgi:hypothetical protein